MPADLRVPSTGGNPGRIQASLPLPLQDMQQRRVPVHCLLAFLLLLLLLGAARPAPAEKLDARLNRLRTEALEMFRHAWHGYLKHAFPEDELDPLNCIGLGKSSNPASPENDVLGDYSLTLVDTLSTLALLGEQEEFEKAVSLAIENVHFDLDSKVQVFEVTIRMLGGLLSAHQLASNPKLPSFISWYDNQLLRLAYDLGTRLLPAFEASPSGIPYPRVNLRYGLLPEETDATCLAGAGTLILEMGMLSRLTNDQRFETVAKRSMVELWRRRSDIDLLGNVINVTSGQWMHIASSVGAGADSFIEYLMKSYILFGECDYFDAFEAAYNAIMDYVLDPTGFILRNVDMFHGQIIAPWVDSLSAFFPALQVLAGEVASARRIHSFYNAIWERYGAMPERFDFFRQEAVLSNYPLRPEFVESTYMLYRATKDPFYIDVGEKVMRDIQNKTRTECGFASIKDVYNMTLENRMESFFLSETLKYLYLLFDPGHPINRMDSNLVFTTEAHPLVLPRALQTPKPCLSDKPPPVCPVFDPGKSFTFSSSAQWGSHVQTEVDIARALVGLATPWSRMVLLSDGICEITPPIDLHPQKGSIDNMLQTCGLYDDG